MQVRWVRLRATIILLALGLAAAMVSAQTDDMEPMDASEQAAPRLDAAAATALLAQPLPDDAAAGYALLQRQYRAARNLEDRPRSIALARQLITAGRGQPGGEYWIRAYLNSEFTWGSSGAALEAAEPFVTDTRLSIATRAGAALRQTYFAAQRSNDTMTVGRLWSRADGLSAQAVQQGGADTTSLPVERLQVRSEIERLDGRLAQSLATLREAVGVGRRTVETLRQRGLGPRDAALQDASGWLDGTLGMLTYALVRQGRAQEAVEIAQQNMALSRARQLDEGQAVRWNYRLATALVATQQYEPALAAALRADEMLRQAGVNPASHTAWLARQETVRALMGLKRWSEADVSYREFLASLGNDSLARSRALDNRLLALLAAKSGRLDEALDISERQHRYRMRLYGAHHPQTQEAAGVRAVVRLMRGDVSRAMDDYEELFAATLDNPGGWLDLDLRGFRGFVLGLAFDEYLQYVADRALRGDAVPPAMSDRAMQLADRAKLGVTQRALTDSTARLLAATPALRALLDQEQTLRQQASALFGKVSTGLGDEDRLRRETGTPEFRNLMPDQRRPREAELRAARDQIRAAQAEAAAAREALDQQRETISRQYPAYADLVTPASPRPDQLRALLGEGEALAIFQPLDNATLIWLVAADGSRAFRASPLGAAALAKRVTELRGMLDLGAAPPGKPPALDTAALYALYRDLLLPIEPQIRGQRSLIVATDGPLASLPFAALVTQPPQPGQQTAWLVRQTALTQLPSASALQALRRVVPTTAPRALLGFGDPLFDLDAGKPRTARGQSLQNASRYDAEWGFRYADVPPLPETRVELAAVAAALGADPRTDLVLGAAATRAAVLAADLSDRRVVAFATHGLMPGELPGVSRPALAMAATTDERESPLLELDDVLGLRLNAQWVLLSACNTAAGGEQGGAAMSGLVRGFFFAGARSVLATHWAVDSQSAAALSGSTFKAQAGGAASRAESLRQAQLAMIDGGRWTHPYHWAPYALFGDPKR